jgi:hypothetical protein
VTEGTETEGTEGTETEGTEGTGRDQHGGTEARRREKMVHFTHGFVPRLRPGGGALSDTRSCRAYARVVVHFTHAFVPRLRATRGAGRRTNAARRG